MEFTVELKKSPFHLESTQVIYTRYGRAVGELQVGEDGRASIRPIIHNWLLLTPENLRALADFIEASEAAMKDAS